MHSPQLTQASTFILASVPCISMAECWHTFEHFAQPMHPTVQFFLTTAPLSMLEHATVYSLDFGTILIIF